MELDHSALKPLDVLLRLPLIEWRIRKTHRRMAADGEAGTSGELSDTRLGRREVLTLGSLVAEGEDNRVKEFFTRWAHQEFSVLSAPVRRRTANTPTD